jgi:hypothetical protein
MPAARRRTRACSVVNASVIIASGARLDGVRARTACGVRGTARRGMSDEHRRS